MDLPYVFISKCKDAEILTGRSVTILQHHQM